ncbi:MAG: NAD-dependent epimerase/dehydratase [Candidatus Shapirobacteria bacterium GW2011_GWE1_38_10]|uniref:NAD-dependent epimerase/dehydratase n=1 Tax=Candidatus Shapirobacteria bacterium GW2011_GWE1_38_10 TaxID=1618488 RepID=A0A0G0I3L7_9BACT|nr:MAG: NAD-dependent epimerase/dehydratase [Candidatus Shapirobacteria bacterium GW2011_GWF2_37_20]KKQ49933.1 MAG: NAD-dependent epimerase/dehydratase [Candidatus Shapirobacteria bacterium GW2011_GWE1_38_10]KKQ63095.1 MAG: NAD-dependent epimerase/dehydratase [Candidatus Shapirobacteria bacterium GW2011_GWF1_38_23]HBP51524.1 CDP-paratose 2-epimerase [Candidatus Shapirobacteria bacterium]
MKHLVIGGAGFIGSNLANTLLKSGDSVTILDNLSREGSKKNLDWLQTQYPNLEFIKADIVTDQEILNNAVKSADRIYHLAAQVAVTSSVLNPRHDFEINALGTLNVLEALRLYNPKAVLIFASTNKVYGNLDNLEIEETESRYKLKNIDGVSELQPLDFHSPYGCSKGSGDQYVRDYGRIYDLNTIVFRQSCIYGPRQFGVEDQGWVAWFIIALMTQKPITIYGDGKQVRDLLYVDDLIRAYQMAADNIEKTRGQVFNLGGGPDNSISIYFDFKKLLEKLFGKNLSPPFLPARPGDQKIYISDISKAKKYFNWEPKIDVENGLENLYLWVKENLSLFS